MTCQRRKRKLRGLRAEVAELRAELAFLREREQRRSDELSKIGVVFAFHVHDLGRRVVGRETGLLREVLEYRLTATCFRCSSGHPLRDRSRDLAYSTMIDVEEVLLARNGLAAVLAPRLRDGAAGIGEAIFDQLAIFRPFTRRGGGGT